MAKSKTFKVVISIILVILLIFIGTGAYIIFGVAGIDEKHVYPQSEAVMNNSGTGKTVLDTTATYQTMNGFGASACWWSQDIGSWENSEEILSYLYDKDKGIGLNIYRYNLGAGSVSYTHLTLPTTSRV